MGRGRKDNVDASSQPVTLMLRPLACCVTLPSSSSSSSSHVHVASSGAEECDFIGCRRSGTVVTSSLRPLWCCTSSQSSSHCSQVCDLRTEQDTHCKVAYRNTSGFLKIKFREQSTEKWQKSLKIKVIYTNVSPLPGETWTPKIGSLQSCCIPKTTLLWLDNHEPILIIFGSK